LREENEVTKLRWVVALALLLGSSVSAVVVAGRGQAQDQLPEAEARERNLRAYTELLRSDIRTQKVALITQIMAFTEAEDAKFWPIYREYELDLSRLNDERLQLIETYAAIYTKLTDAQANDVVVKALDLESRRTALKQNYFAKLKTALPPRLAAKALHIEHQLELLVDLQVAASLPVTTAK
jgi:hypothetical protein